MAQKVLSTYEMNNYLKPLVDELHVLMHGVTKNTKNNGTQTIKAALSLCMMDFPAQKKVAGFTSFNSKHPCHKCRGEFGEISGTKNHARDFNGFEDDSWVRRTCEEHRAQAKAWRMAPIKARRKELEAKNGTRWSVLLKLPYFDPIRHVGVDVMHNILLGITKKMAVCWTSRFKVNEVVVQAVLGNEDLRAMQKSLEEGFLLPQATQHHL